MAGAPHLPSHALPCRRDAPRLLWSLQTAVPTPVASLPPLPPSAPAWHAGLDPELVAANTATLAVVEHVAATLPGGFHGYSPSAPLPATLADGEQWSVVTEEHDVKVRRGVQRRGGARSSWPPRLPH